jgi:hypothetical protein
MDTVNVKSLLNSENNKNGIVSMELEGKKYKWLYWVGNYPVSRHVKELTDKVLARMPHLKVFPKSASQTKVIDDNNTETTIRTIRELYLYVDECPFALGSIGYKNYTVSHRAHPTETYGVFSRKIRNAKYSDVRNEYNLMTTSNIDKAVNLVMGFITPYTDKELAGEYYRDITNRVDDVRRKANNDVENALRNIKYGGDKTLAMELIALKATGYRFKTNEFNEALDKIEIAFNKRIEEERRKVNAIFVRLRNVGGDTYADVLEADDITSNSKPNFVSPPTTYSMDNLPEYILNGISVLNILQDGQYVERIGQKLDETSFWLEKERV